MRERNASPKFEDAYAEKRIDLRPQNLKCWEEKVVRI